MSAVTRFKQSVSHGKECKARQPLSASAWATPCSVLTCTAYVCLMTPSALGVGLPLRPWNISCFITHASTLNILHYAPESQLSALAITTLDLPTLLAASGVHPSWQPAVHRLTCAFLRKTSQLPRL
ncbi:hypothetical protein E2C01_092786 [Portunus trituberculatus]|uniref:Uncharacterized protein n=1 Tax=Portunus trituberculatus TaxID=210409 RepID=A0A5B7JRJ4_PORTR|nr:hypothetical protein [Portunus trituberculatus]